MDLLWSETFWSNFKYFIIILIVSTNYIFVLQLDNVVSKSSLMHDTNVKTVCSIWRTSVALSSLVAGEDYNRTHPMYLFNSKKNVVYLWQWPGFHWRGLNEYSVAQLGFIFEHNLKKKAVNSGSKFLWNSQYLRNLSLRLRMSLNRRAAARYRPARGDPGICHFSFLSNFH